MNENLDLVSEIFNAMLHMSLSLYLHFCVSFHTTYKMNQREQQNIETEVHELISFLLM